MEKSPNALIHSSSPYLQQHAFNPVYWYPWGPEALEKAKEENKLLIISIGYSACHWCHVMEHESFEDDEVATVMNKFFISIKVDREERPDIDQLYMDAVQLLNGQGGWPLNCIALPDQRPLFGGTYFPKEQWRSVLLQLAKLWQTDPDKCIAYAAELSEGIEKHHRQLLPVGKQEVDLDFNLIYNNWSKQFDTVQGGMLRAPKFPMPDNYRFLLAYSKLADSNPSKEHVLLTLRQMARGGIYDQLGGGFARYSTDMEWKVPHFEKMLYDNAQLALLYTEAWQVSHDSFYREVAEDIFRFITNELTQPEGGFYSALDADTEGVEGKFYTWTEDELREASRDDFEFVKEYFEVNSKGLWEHERYILLRTGDEEKIAAKYGLNAAELQEKVENIKSYLTGYRNKRVRPGLDSKVICAWNALMIKAYAYAGRVFGDEEFIAIALRHLEFIQEDMQDADHTLLHVYPGENEKPIPAFLDDYAFMIDAMIALYQVTFDEKWIQEALELTRIVIRDFDSEESLFFYFTSVQSEKLLHRKIELQDNVTPSGNAVMAENLYSLGIISGNAGFVSRSQKMTQRMSSEVDKLAPWYSRWALAALLNQKGRNEVVFAGKNSIGYLQEWMQEYHPSVLLAGAEEKSGLSLLKGRIPENEDTLIYVCRNRVCELPVNNADMARKLIQE
jgi:uncharacterized protein YyaL (SSP411 family)